MTWKHPIPSAALVLVLVAGLPVLAAAETVEGEVIATQERVRTHNGGELEELRIRTRDGEELRLRLGEPGSCGDCVREGDRVRARLSGGPGPDGARRVRRLRVERSQTRYTFRDRSGNLVQTRVRSRFSGPAGDGGHSVATRQGQGKNGQGGDGRGGGGRGGGGGGGGGGR